MVNNPPSKNTVTLFSLWQAIVRAGMFLHPGHFLHLLKNNCMQNPFDHFTSLQKAMLYRVLISYRSKLQTNVCALNSYGQEIDDITLMLDLAGYQLEQLKPLIEDLEKTVTVDELSILPHFTEYIKANDIAAYNLPRVS